MARGWQLVMDCADPAGMTAFWCEALGYVEQPVPEGFASWPEALVAYGIPVEEHGDGGAIVDPDGRGPRIYFQRVPEPKQVKNRLHVDVPVSAGPGSPPEVRAVAQDAERDRLIALGASEVGVVREHGERWIVMQDPEGNEFCIT